MTTSHDTVQVHGEFLQRFHWDMLATLTFSKPTNDNGARRAIATFADRLARPDNTPYAYWILEHGRDSYTPHVHALIGGIGQTTPKEAAGQWKRGYSRITRYDPQKAGAFYVSKEIMIRDAVWDFFGTPLPATPQYYEMRK